ncbi:MAG: hypothetical protein CMJ32_06220 [Phycisphaerae bacterium]|nr:hypothetical protein [Phycisphaerae bacterium]
MSIEREAPRDADVPMPSRHLVSRIVIPAALILAAGALIYFSGLSTFRSRTDVVVFPVTGTSIETTRQQQEDTGGVLFQAAGWVEPDPFPINASVLVAGVVETVLVLEGDTVKKGQLLATLNKEDSEITYRNAKANLTLAMARKQEAQARVAQLHSARKVMEDELDRMEKAFAKDAVTERAVVQMRLKIDSHQQECDAASITAGVLSDAQIQIAQVEVDRAQLALARTEIFSPIDGVVLERLAEPGMPRSPTMEHARMGYIARLYDPESLQVRVDMPLAEAASIGVGQPAEIIVDVLPGRTFKGVVTRLVHQADIQKNTIEAKVRILDPDRALKPEMLSRVRFLEATRARDEEKETTANRPIRIPFDAVVSQREGEATVLVIDSTDRTAQNRNIEVEIDTDDSWLVVKNGLNPGDRLIIDPGGSIAEGESVRITGEWARGDHS